MTPLPLKKLALALILSMLAHGAVFAVEKPPAVSESISVEELGTVDLISMLANPDKVARKHAFDKLHRKLVEETDAEDYYDHLTLFHKHAPHACKKNNEAQTLLILALFAAQEDVTSILIKQCLRSEFASVRCAALEMAHFSDNKIEEELLAFEPDEKTINSYRFALEKLGTRKALSRLAALN